MEQDKRAAATLRLLGIMDELRAKCPWDRKQTFETLRDNTIEETYELADAILDGNMDGIREELGDLMLHIVFYSKLGEEAGAFDYTDVVNDLCDKLIYRHPHVYGEIHADTPDEVKRNWEALKLRKKHRRSGTLGGVPVSLPAMVKAVRIGEKAAGAGFDWEKKEDVWAKVREEIGFEIPLAIDHMGHISEGSVIALARRLEKYNIAWIEDAAPWMYGDILHKISESTTIPVCTGEDIYLAENFEPLLKNRAVSVVHPDVLTVGGAMEMKRLEDLCEKYGIAMAIHMAESPVAFMAAVHIAARAEAAIEADTYCPPAMYMSAAAALAAAWAARKVAAAWAEHTAAAAHNTAAVRKDKRAAAEDIDNLRADRTERAADAYKPAAPG